MTHMRTRGVVESNPKATRSGGSLGPSSAHRRVFSPVADMFPFARALHAADEQEPPASHGCVASGADACAPSAAASEAPPLLATGGFGALSFPGRTSPVCNLNFGGSSSVSGADELEFGAPMAAPSRVPACGPFATTSASTTTAASASATSAASAAAHITKMFEEEEEIEMISSPAVLREAAGGAAEITAEAECNAFLSRGPPARGEREQRAGGFGSGFSVLSVADHLLHQSTGGLLPEGSTPAMTAASTPFSLPLSTPFASPALAMLAPKPSSAPDRMQKQLTARPQILRKAHAPSRLAEPTCTPAEPHGEVASAASHMAPADAPAPAPSELFAPVAAPTAPPGTAPPPPPDTATAPALARAAALFLEDAAPATTSPEPPAPS